MDYFNKMECYGKVIVLWYEIMYDVIFICNLGFLVEILNIG